MKSGWKVLFVDFRVQEIEEGSQQKQITSFESSDRRVQQGILSAERVWKNLKDSQLRLDEGRKEVFLREVAE